MCQLICDLWGRLRGLDLNQSPSKGHNQIGLGILSGKDTKSLKIGPEMAEKSQVQFFSIVGIFSRSFVFFAVVRFFYAGDNSFI